MLLSVIIPVYNVEKYLEKCILSVINNNLDIGDYEIIVVDDESPDDSLRVVQSLMDGYSQIKLISQRNKGLGGARNSGMRSACGEYILFLDADDFLEEGALKQVVLMAKNNRLDILEFGAIGIGENGKEFYRYSKMTEPVLSGLKYLENMRYMNSACNKLYSISFLNEYGLVFKERIFIEDYEFNTRAFFYARKVVAIPNVLGCFVQTENSITRNVNIAKKIKMIEDIEEVIRLTLQFKFEVRESSRNIDLFFDQRVAYLTVTLLFQLMKLPILKRQRERILDRLRDKNLYPVKTPVLERKKNIFRIVCNRQICFNQLCFIMNIGKKRAI